MLKICEIFKSIQGESTYSGCICSFVRLTGCNLCCSYCDTTYAFSEGTYMEITEIVDTVKNHKTNLIEITGGEPLIQNETPELCREFIKKGYKVLVETNGSLDISVLPRQCIKIMDIKCPASNMKDSFLMTNLNHLQKQDECKFVISHAEDFHWASEFVSKHNLHSLSTVIFSPNTQNISAQKLSELILKTNTPVRLGLQLHKIIWGEKRGV